MSEYGIWLSFNNQAEGFRIPVNPDAIEILESGQGKTYDIHKLGEINVIKSPKLTGIEFKSEFPAQPYPFVVGDQLLPPLTYINLIEKWRRTKHPIRFTFTGSTVDINTPVSIEKFNWREVAGATGDIEYDITFKKYVFYAAKKITIQRQSGSAQVLIEPPKRPDERIPPKTYKLAPGDNLLKVAKKTLDDDSKWREIQRINSLSDAQLKKLPVGLELKLPT